jgi:hypothetical protein
MSMYVVRRQVTTKMMMMLTNAVMMPRRVDGDQITRE